MRRSLVKDATPLSSLSVDEYLRRIAAGEELRWDGGLVDACWYEMHTVEYVGELAAAKQPCDDHESQWVIVRPTEETAASVLFNREAFRAARCFLWLISDAP